MNPRLKELYYSKIQEDLAKKLLLVERIPWVCALLEDGINRFYKEIPDLNKIEVICEDSNKYLDSLKQKNEEWTGSMYIWNGNCSNCVQYFGSVFI